MRFTTKMALAPLMLAMATGASQTTAAPPDPVQNFKAGKSRAELKDNGVYIVRMADDPVAAYDGGIKGYRATRPGKNKKLNPNDPAVVAYSRYLTDKHDALLNKVRGGAKLYSYKFAYNGFAAKLTEAQANALRKEAGVLAVVKDELLQRDTVSTPEFLGLRDEDGLWDQLGGIDAAGEGIVVGIVDSGIWPENPSFSDRTGSNSKGKSGKLDFRQLPGWHGKCTPGAYFTASDCNQKLIGAQWFNAGYGGDAGVLAALPYEFASARDADGHGSHTASTAAGNADMDVVINGSYVGQASGMAPRARVAAYKVCWGVGNDGGCFGSDSMAAIDQAVIDGVDVINFSISGSRTSFLDQVEVAFLYAADAGVFVAASAGNSGPDASTVAHNSPWLTTVAAGTHDRGYEAFATIEGDPAEYEGVSLGAGAGPASLVYSANVGLAGEDSTEVTLCYPGTLDPALVSGKIVLCDRGVIARVDKSLAVAQAGGVGMILANTSPSSLNADFHSVPSLHVDTEVGDILRDYAITGEAVATISPGESVPVDASHVAAFSSRGPALAGNGDLLKPDIMAPGVDIIAAISPYSGGGENYGTNSGTSMSSPHIAGLGALMKQLHPDWSPAMIKSAMMTSATQTTTGGDPIDVGPFGYGAGFVQPNAAADPGLVYDAGWDDWINFLCGMGALSQGNCEALDAVPIDASDLNYPSIAIGALAGAQTVTRTVTNVTSSTLNVSAVVDAPAGVDVAVTPATLEVDAGESATYEVTFTVTDAAAPYTWAFGALTWSAGEYNVRSPIALYPVAISAPNEIALDGTSGSASFPVIFGYAGDYSVAVSGLTAADAQEDSVADDPTDEFDTDDPASNQGYTSHDIEISAGVPLARFSTFNAYTSGDDDLDLFVYDADNNLVGVSAAGSSDEEVTLTNPAPGIYTVYVHGWQTDLSVNNGVADYTLFVWLVSGADDGNLTATPSTATAAIAAEGQVDLSWSGLEENTKYLGVLSHQGNGGEEVGRTVVGVSTD